MAQVKFIIQSSLLHFFLFCRSPYVPQTFLRGARKKNVSPSIMEHLLTNTNKNKKQYHQTKRILKTTQRKSREKSISPPDQKPAIQTIDSSSSPGNSGTGKFSPYPRKRPMIAFTKNQSPPISPQCPPEVHLPSPSVIFSLTNLCTTKLYYCQFWKKEIFNPLSANVMHVWHGVDVACSGCNVSYKQSHHEKMISLFLKEEKIC